MIAGIDHAIVLVNDLQAAIDNARSAGFTAWPGGVHDDNLTQNALIAFADGTYIELMTFVDDTVPPGHYFGDRYFLGTGLADLALLSTDIDSDVQAISQSGLEFPIPTHLGRHRPDGTLVAWRMSLPRGLHPSSGLPFLIQDLTDRSLRVPSSPAETSHANGAIGIAGISIVVNNITTMLPQFRAMLGRTGRSGSEMFGGRGLSMIPLGGDSCQWIALMQPVPDSAPRRYMDRFGPGPYAISLRTRMNTPVVPGEGRLVPSEFLGGARIYIQEERETPAK